MDTGVIPYKLMFSIVILNDVIFKVILCLFGNGIALIKNLGSLCIYVQAFSGLIKLSFVLSC